MMKEFLVFHLCLLLFSLNGFGQQAVYDITGFGAVGDGVTDNTAAIQRAVDQCSQTGGRIIFPEGIFLSGTVRLASDITIELTAKSVWMGLPDISAYPLIEPEILSRMDMVPRRAMIYARDKQNITITGKGTFYPNGDKSVFQNHIGDSPDRPFGIQMVNCRNITVSGITMRNSAYWMQRYFHCDNLRFEDLYIFNHCNLNNDGLDIDGCHKVVVTGCVIDASDDALVFKSEGMRTCEDVVVSNCVLRSQASALKWGTGSVGGFRFFTVSNCVIRPSEARVMNHPLGSWAGLVGIDMGNVDGGIMEDILVQNIVVDSIETPIFIRLGKRNARNFAGEDSFPDGVSRNIQLSNITGSAAGKISCAITAYAGNYIQNLSLTNISFSFPGGGTEEDVSDEVPDAAQSYPINRMFNTNLPSYGFYFRHIRGLYMSNVKMSLRSDDSRPAIVLDDVHDMTMRDIYPQKPVSGEPAVLIRNSEDILVYGTDHAVKISDFLQVKDSATRNIRIFNPYSGVPAGDTPPANLNIFSYTDRINVNLLSWEKTLDDGGTGYFVILRDGKPLATTRDTVYADIHVKGDRVYKYSVGYRDGFGRTSSFLSQKIKTVPDHDRPFVDHFRLVNNHELVITFSEPVDTLSATDASHYRFSPVVDIRNVTLSNQGEDVILSVDSLFQGEKYTLDISGITDRATKPNVLKDYQTVIIDKPVVLHILTPNDLKNFSDPAKNPYQTKGVRVLASGRGACFNGESSFIRIPDTRSLNFSGDMAISVWFLVNDPTENKYMRILSKRSAWNSPDGYELEINPGEHRINFSGAAASPDMQGVIKYSFDRDWHQLIAMIRNDSAIFFIDGKPAGEDPLVALPYPNQTDLYLGTTPLGKDHFDGCIGDLFIFSRSLSTEEVSKLYRREFPGYDTNNPAGPVSSGSGPAGPYSGEKPGI